MLENIWTFPLQMDLAPFGPYVRGVVRIFLAALTAQPVNVKEPGSLILPYAGLR